MAEPAQRYALADPDHCGVLYRPGELSMPGINHCRLDAGHGGKYHSTRRSEYEPGGYEWLVVPPAGPVDWPRP